MFYRLMYKRGIPIHRKSYFNIIVIFSIVLTMSSFTNIMISSLVNYDEAVAIPDITKDWTCDWRVWNVTEAEAELFTVIPYVHVEYKYGNADITLTDGSQAEYVYNMIDDIFRKNFLSEHYHDRPDDERPLISVYYGIDPHDNIQNDDYWLGWRIKVIVYQIIMSLIGIEAMVMIYGDYINRREGDIRTLYAVGIGERQLKKLFFGECNILYALSAAIGVPLGILIAYLFCVICNFFDMSAATSIYPVFNVDLVSLLASVLLGYLVIYITFTVILKRILSIDVSYNDAGIIFDPDKSRYLFYRAKNRFDTFFSSILKKRVFSKYKLRTALLVTVVVICVLFTSIFDILISSSLHDGESASDIIGYISQYSLEFMLISFCYIFSLVIIFISNKRQLESCAGSLKVLSCLGADEVTLYRAFRRYSLRWIIFTEALGLLIGYALSMYFYIINRLFYLHFITVAIVLTIVISHIVICMTSTKKYFKIIYNQI